ncbi:MAG: RDD family protein [Gammaproteobacteria bacterium]|nr:RDD family protein [Gammaproteobacteria bacterium]
MTAQIPVPAGLLRRLGAMAYDTILVAALAAFTLIPIVAVNKGYIVGAPVQTLLFLELYGFFTYFWLTRRQTLGMLAWRLTIQTLNDQPLRLSQVTLRFVGALLSFFCLGLGYLWVLFDKQRRSWSDLLSSTRVVYRARTPES